MRDSEFKLDSTGELSDEEWIIKNGITEKFYIHFLLNNMLKDLNLNLRENDELLCSMQKRLVDILICLEFANHQNIMDGANETMANDFGKVALGIGFDIMLGRMAKNDSINRHVYIELRDKYMSHQLI